jgi:hypothetical protein
MTRHHLGPVVRNFALGAFALVSASVIGSGCLDRPVVAANPTVTARVVDRAKQNKVARIDLLFMIDNSSSMADKQGILAAVVGDLVGRLVDPACIDPMTGTVVGARLANGGCAVGEPDFDAVKDIHIGIISSSLGSHGASDAMGREVCGDPDTQMRANAHNKDMAHLLNRSLVNGVEGTVSQAARGFLAWTGAVGANANTDIVAPFQSMVTGVGQHGCGYEAQLESIYRFLNDPTPYQQIDIIGKTNTDPGQALPSSYATPPQYDTTLLQQRRDFLRPDSLVAVIAVTDENDCSINDNDPQGFFALLPPVASSQGTISALRSGTSICQTDPNNKCCFNCGVAKTPDGCSPAAQDPACMANGGILTHAQDPENLRCFDQKRHYGKDFLFPVDRYIEGFTKLQVTDRNGNPVPNPLYSDLSCTVDATGKGKDATGAPCQPIGARDPTFVFFAGIVGVPWQDIAVDPMDLTKGYKTSKDINDQNVWKTILGDPTTSPPIPPTDEHMVESVGVRPNLAGIDSAPTADPINGHEWDISKSGPPNADLQYACVFDLPTPTVCVSTNSDCDCNDSPPGSMGGTVADMKNPLCQAPGGAYGSTQYRAKGYPCLRELQVLKGIGDQAIVASICPANVNPMQNTRADYGYRPAISALVSRLRTALRGRCLPRTLEIGADNKVPCVIIEAFNPPAGRSCGRCEDDTAFRGRVTITDPGLITGEIGMTGTCLCEMKQLDEPDLTLCETQLNLPGTEADGWCYVDPAQQTTDIAGACQVVSSCPDTDKRVIRFATDTSQPRPGATAFITCQEKSFPTSTAGNTLKNPCMATP